MFGEPWEAQSFALTLGLYQEAWRRAADRMPHGEPILLDPGDIEA